MRHIKQGDLSGMISEERLREAEKALAELIKLPPDERSQFIEDHSNIWSSIKEILSRLSYGKCWYSEALIAFSELEVDHFRPKNRVSNAGVRHRGYWWLAFSWQNYRLAYSLINKRRRDLREDNIQGKGCHFPLLDEATRVPDTMPCATTGERPVLIDPCIKSDVRLLDYAIEDGKVVERFSASADRIRHERARISIDLYHLNEGTLIRLRKDIQVSIVHAADTIERLDREREVVGTLTESQEHTYDVQIQHLGNLIHSASHFSAFARACLRQIGSKGWNTYLLEELLESV